MATDRNFVARQREAERLRLEKLNRTIKTAAQAGGLTVLDRIGQPIDKGALVVWRTPFDMVWEVVECVPMLEPGAPPGAVRLVLSCKTPLAMRGGQPEVSMIRVGTQQSEGHASLDKVEAPAEEIPQLGEESVNEPMPGPEPS